MQKIHQHIKIPFISRQMSANATQEFSVQSCHDYL